MFLVILIPKNNHTTIKLVICKFKEEVKVWFNFKLAIPVSLATYMGYTGLVNFVTSMACSIVFILALYSSILKIW